MLPRLGWVLVAAGLAVETQAFYRGPRAAMLERESMAAVGVPAAPFAIAVGENDGDGVCLHSAGAIAAPPDRVVAVMTDFQRQAALSANTAGVTIEQADQDRWRVRYVESIPMWPDTTYTLTWDRVAPGPDTVLRYRGESSGGAADMEGFAHLAADGGRTRYRGIDCFTPPGVWFVRGRAIRAALDQTAQEDLAFFLAAEHPSWTDRQVLSASKDAARQIVGR